MSKPEEPLLPPGSSEAMHEKHLNTVLQNHSILKIKKKRRNKKKNQNEGEAHLLQGARVVTYELADGDNTLPQPAPDGSSVGL